MIIKVPQGEGITVADVTNKLGLSAPIFSKLQFAPSPNASENMHEYITWLEAWENVIPGCSWCAVSFWDTTIPSRTHWLGKAFTWGGVNYTDITDYLKKKTGKRAAIWTPDTTTPAGTSTNYSANWTNFGNSANDWKGSYFYNLAYQHSLQAVITTDRTDVWLKIRNKLNAP